MKNYKFKTGDRLIMVRDGRYGSAFKKGIAVEFVAYDIHDKSKIIVSGAWMRTYDIIQRIHTQDAELLEKHRCAYDNIEKVVMDANTRNLLKKVARLKSVKGSYIGMCGGNDVYGSEKYLVKEVLAVVQMAKKALAEDRKKEAALNTKSKTPAEALGYKLGDKFVVTRKDMVPNMFPINSVIELISDDGTNCPRFKLINDKSIKVYGNDYCYLDNIRPLTTNEAKEQQK